VNKEVEKLEISSISHSVVWKPTQNPSYPSYSKTFVNS